MGTGKELYKELKEWIPKRKRTAKELIQLSNELDRLHHNSQVATVTTTSIAVAGSLTVVGAGILTLLTAGLATPALAMAIGGTATAVTASVGTGITAIVENVQSSTKMETANRIMKEDVESGEKIKELWNKLEEDCKRNEYCRGKGNATSTMLLDAISTYHGLDIPIGVQINMIGTFTTFGVANAATIIPKGMVIAGLTKSIAMIGMHNIVAVAGIASIGGGVIGLGLSVPALVMSSMDLAKGEPTAASSMLKETSKVIEDAVNDLSDQLMQIEETFKQVVWLKQLVETLTYASNATAEGIQIINFIKQRCDDLDVLRWLDKVENVPVFLNNVALFYKDIKKELERESRDQDDEDDEDGHINIVLVAHGKISREFVPAAVMMPLSSIRDVIFYSPWNCLIDHKAAYAIASGGMNIANRIFLNDHDSRRPLHIPNQIPHWNKLSQKITSEIPLHWVSPVSPSEKAWVYLKNLDQRRILSKPKNRIVFPYLQPKTGNPENFPEVPLFAVTYALSVGLVIVGRQATFHVAACAAYSDQNGRFDALYYEQRCARQYAYAFDNTFMSNSIMPNFQNVEVLNAFRSLFDDPKEP